MTVNQAKIYLSIIQSEPTCVSKISESTRLHRQDIYKILPKLEEMKLITKTVDRPVTIKAIPVEEALSYIVSTEQQKANQRIRRLKADLKALFSNYLCLLSMLQDYFEIMWLTALEFKPEEP